MEILRILRMEIDARVNALQKSRSGESNIQDMHKDKTRSVK